MQYLVDLFHADFGFAFAFAGFRDLPKFDYLNIGMFTPCDSLTGYTFIAWLFR
jgi:hypothetical protein